MEVQIAKRDVSRAFKWHEIRPQDVPEFGARLTLPGGQEVIAVSLVMVFGWLGSLGEYMMFAWGAAKYHARFRPNRERWNDEVGYHSHWLMDDGVVVEQAATREARHMTSIAAKCGS